MKKRPHFKRINKRKVIDILIVAGAILLVAYFRFTIPQIIVFGIFTWTIINPVSVRVPAFIALLFLSITPFFLAFKSNAVVLAITGLFFNIKENPLLDGSALAEDTAIYAYYFLILTVIMAIYEIRKEDK